MNWVKIVKVLTIGLSLLLQFTMGIVVAQTKVKQVAVQDVPGLVEYVKKNFAGAKIDPKTIIVKLGDLDEVPDGVDEVLLGVEDFTYWCGTGGCDYRVLKRSTNGEFSELLYTLGFGLDATEGYSNGLRNLVSSTRKGAALLQFDGSLYQFILRGFAKLKSAQASNPKRPKPVYYNGRCHNGNTWSGGQRDITAPEIGGVASYGSCSDGESTFYFECTPGSPQVNLYIEVTMDNFSDGAAVSVPVIVGKKRFKLTGKASYSEMIGGVQPLLTFGRNNGLLDALKKSNSGRFSIGRKLLKFHLKGSSNSIEAMDSACSIASSAGKIEDTNNPELNQKIVAQIELPNTRIPKKATAVQITGDNPPDLLVRVKLVSKEVKRIGSLFEEKKFKQIKKMDLVKLDGELNYILEGTDLKKLPLGFGNLDGLHYTERYGVVDAYRLHFSGDEAAQFDTMINLLDAVSTTFETDFYGFSSILSEAINLKYRNFAAYERMIELMGKFAGGCTLSGGYDYGPERHDAGLCISNISRRGFASSGDFFSALEWARESARYMELLNKSNPAITAPIRFDLAELELSHGRQSAGKQLIAELSIDELKILRSDENRKGRLDQQLLKTNSFVRLPAANLNPSQSELKEYFSELLETDNIPNVERAAILLRLLQKNKLPKTMVKGLKKKLLSHRTSIGNRSANANLDLALLLNFETGLTLHGSSDLGFSSFLFDQNAVTKRRKARAIYRQLFDVNYGQFGNEVGFYKTMTMFARAMEIIGYPSAARETRLQVFENLTNDLRDPADQMAMMVTLAPQFLDLHSRLAQVFLSTKNYRSALKHLEAIIPIASQRFAKQWKTGTQDIGDSITQLAPHLRRALKIWSGIATSKSGIKQNRIAKGAFKTAQLMQLGEVALAIQAGARRTLLGNDQTAESLKKYERITSQSLHLAGIRNNYKLRVPDGIENALIASHERGVLAEKQVHSILPFIEAFTNVAPVSLTKIQKYLGSKEAMITIVPTGEKTFILAVDKRSAKFSEIGLSSSELAEKISKLRKGLDPLQINLQEFISFDTKLAHSLYQDILGSVEEILARNRRIVLVATGAATSIPFSVLVSKDPASASGFKDVEWTAKRHAFTSAVSVAGFVAARANPKVISTAERKPIIGFGNPVFDPSRRTQTGYQNAERQFASLSRGIKTDVSLLASAPPLPETKDELYSVAQSLNASVEHILLGQSASETTLKGLSQEGNLSQYKVVYFATHGLVAGELDGSNEPGLVLSVPEVQSDLDDGLLSSSEISQLRLNADWVVLSACNTAAPGKPGADALSGLAKSFFKAGSRSVLASHWPVISTAAVKLTTGTFRKLAAFPSLSRAEALRQTMMAILSDAKNTGEQHPAYWAPFVLVGNGDG